MDCPVAARPTVIVISDSLGDTACEVVLAASGQFDEGAFLCFASAQGELSGAGQVVCRSARRC